MWSKANERNLPQIVELSESTDLDVPYKNCESKCIQTRRDRVAWQVFTFMASNKVSNSSGKRRHGRWQWQRAAFIMGGVSLLARGEEIRSLVWYRKLLPPNSRTMWESCWVIIYGPSLISHHHSVQSKCAIDLSKRALFIHTVGLNSKEKRPFH